MSIEEPSTVKEWATQVNEDLHSMRHTLAEMEYLSKRSIHKVPEYVTDLNPKAYKPQAASFGPYHHGQPHLCSMEEHKHRALFHFLKRCDKPIGHFISALDAVASDLMASYDPLDYDKWTKDNIVKMMLLDGCFMLEILRTAVEIVNDYAPNDPIFSAHGKLYIMPYIKRDMLMLENQLPMLVLDKLLSVETDGKQDEEFINRLIVKFFSGLHITEMGKCLHVLDVYRKSLLRHVRTSRLKHPKAQVRRKMRKSEDEIICSATELDEAGIEFESSKTEIFTDIEFDNGVLRLPRLVVDNFTESMFLNLIAYERFHAGAGSDITSYIFFIRDIIVRERDVALLHSSGIIQNDIGSDKAVANLFNSLPKDAMLEPESDLEYALDQVSKEVSVYCKKPWNKWRASLIHTYFENPWTILSLIGAIILFALTIVQTVYSVLSVQ